MQALARRFYARCLAIRIAQARITKYIDPTTTLPYWVHPGTGVTSWTKPKIFGAQDAEHATMVATSKTEHLVSSIICSSLRDSTRQTAFHRLISRLEIGMALQHFSQDARPDMIILQIYFEVRLIVRVQVAIQTIPVFPSGCEPARKYKHVASPPT